MKKKAPLPAYIPSEEPKAPTEPAPKAEVPSTVVAAPATRVRTLAPVAKRVVKKTVVQVSPTEKYFPPRNDRTPTLKEGENYTKSTLDSSITAETANEISSLLNKKMPGRRPYLIYQTESGIGVLTLALLENPD